MVLPVLGSGPLGARRPSTGVWWGGSGVPHRGAESARIAAGVMGLITLGEMLFNELLCPFGIGGRLRCGDPKCHGVLGVRGVTASLEEAGCSLEPVC